MTVLDSDVSLTSQIAVGISAWPSSRALDRLIRGGVVQIVIETRL